MKKDCRRAVAIGGTYEPASQAYAVAGGNGNVLQRPAETFSNFLRTGLLGDWPSGWMECQLPEKKPNSAAHKQVANQPAEDYPSCSHSFGLKVFTDGRRTKFLIQVTGPFLGPSLPLPMRHPGA